jgi:hypothetical protein
VPLVSRRRVRSAIATALLGSLVLVLGCEGEVEKPPSPPPPPTVPPQAGAALPADPALLAGGRDVEWLEQRVRLRVPASWVERARGPRSLDLGPPDRPETYLVARVTKANQGSPSAQLNVALLDGAASEQRAGEIAGYALRPLGGTSPGVLSVSFPQPDGSAAARWTGYVGEGAAQRLVTFVMVAGGPEHARAAALLGAIVSSIAFD